MRKSSVSLDSKGRGKEGTNSRLGLTLMTILQKDLRYAKLQGSVAMFSTPNAVYLAAGRR